MALSLPFSVSVRQTPSTPPPPILFNPTPPSKTRPLSFVNIFQPDLKRLTITNHNTKATPRRCLVTKAIEKESAESEAAVEEQLEQKPGGSTSDGEQLEQKELGEEIKKTMMERKSREEGGGGSWWSGVAEEIQEIEWPAIGKVFGTTWVVVGVIVGSSVVLLTVNAVLAELSDRVFAGRGVQDFFS